MDEEKSLYQEIERTCTLFNIRKGARAVTDLYAEILSTGGVSTTQFILLTAVKNHEPVSMSKLADGLHLARTTLTRTLKPLQEKGWIEIGSGKDRRVQEIRLTERGNTLLAETVPLWRQAQTLVQEQLGHSTWSQLLTGLQAAMTLNEGRKLL